MSKRHTPLTRRFVAPIVAPIVRGFVAMEFSLCYLKNDLYIWVKNYTLWICAFFLKLTPPIPADNIIPDKVRFTSNFVIILRGVGVNDFQTNFYSPRIPLILI